jgi:signal transduction histidine kinase
MLCAPLRVQNRFIGAIHLRSFEERAYDTRHLSLIERFAAQIAPAIAMARLHETIIRQAEQRATVAEERARSMLLEAERDELQRTNEARRKLLTLVSHELKTPLAAAKAFLELLTANREGNLSERQFRQLSAALGSANHLEMLVDDLLDLSRLDAGAFRLVKRSFDLAALIDEEVATMAPIFDRMEQRIGVEVERPIGTTIGDPDRIGQVISNLLSNASKFSPRGSAIALRCYSREPYVVIEVTDRGIGIAPEDEARLFSPFMRADNPETRAVPGTGLGLYIASSIVSLHGGRMDVHSTRGAGSTFVVELPRSEPASDAVKIGAGTDERGSGSRVS